MRIERPLVWLLAVAVAAVSAFAYLTRPTPPPETELVVAVLGAVLVAPFLLVAGRLLLGGRGEFG